MSGIPTQMNQGFYLNYHILIDDTELPFNPEFIELNIAGSDQVKLSQTYGGYTETKPAMELENLNINIRLPLASLDMMHQGNSAMLGVSAPNFGDIARGVNEIGRVYKREYVESLAEKGTSLIPGLNRWGSGKWYDDVHGPGAGAMLAFIEYLKEATKYARPIKITIIRDQGAPAAAGRAGFELRTSTEMLYTLNSVDVKEMANTGIFAEIYIRCTEYREVKMRTGTLATTAEGVDITNVYANLNMIGATIVYDTPDDPEKRTLTTRARISISPRNIVAASTNLTNIRNGAESSLRQFLRKLQGWGSAIQSSSSGIFTAASNADEPAFAPIDGEADSLPGIGYDDAANAMYLTNVPVGDKALPRGTLIPLRL